MVMTTLVSIRRVRTRQPQRHRTSSPGGKFIAVTGRLRLGKSTCERDRLTRRSRIKLSRVRVRPGGTKFSVDGIEVFEPGDRDRQRRWAHTALEPSHLRTFFTHFASCTPSRRTPSPGSYKPAVPFNVKGGRCETCKATGQIQDRDAILTDV